MTMRGRFSPSKTYYMHLTDYPHLSRPHLLSMKEPAGERLFTERDGIGGRGKIPRRVVPPFAHGAPARLHFVND